MIAVSDTAQKSPANMMTPVTDGDLVYSGAPRSGGAAVKISKGDDGKLKADEVYFDKGLDEVKNCEHRHPDQKPPPMT